MCEKSGVLSNDTFVKNDRVHNETEKSPGILCPNDCEREGRLLQIKWPLQRE